MESNKHRLSEYVRELGWSHIRLAQELGIAPLTVQRWQKKDEPEGVARNRDGLKKTSKKREGRPSKVPAFVVLALNFLLLREGKKFIEPVAITIELPDTIGAMLPILAHNRDLFKQQNLNVTIHPCDTGTEALNAVLGGHAEIAGAAKGLIERYREALVDMGVVFRSTRAFNFLLFSKKGLGSRSFGQSIDDFKRSIIVYPEGSDLGNLLDRLKDNFDRSDWPELLGRDRVNAIEELKQRAKELVKGSDHKRRLIYIAWEPLTSRIHDSLKNEIPKGVELLCQTVASKPLERELSYEFHLVCSRRWCEEKPAAAFDFICALAQAELEYAKDRFTSLQNLWSRFGLTPRSDDDWKGDIEGLAPRYTVAFEPCSQLLRWLGKDKVVVLDRASLSKIRIDGA